MAFSDVLSVIGAVTGGTSLAWNVAAYRLAGGRASVEIGTGIYKGGSLYTMPTPKEGINVYDNPIGSSFDPVLVIRVFSKGRQGLTIDGVKLVDRLGMSYLPARFLEGGPPARLDVHASHTILLRMSEVNVNVHEGLRRTAMTELWFRAAVHFGNGTTKKSKPLRFYAGEDPHVVERGSEPDEANDHEDK